MYIKKHKQKEYKKYHRVHSTKFPYYLKNELQQITVYT